MRDEPHHHENDVPGLETTVKVQSEYEQFAGLAVKPKHGGLELEFRAPPRRDEPVPYIRARLDEEQARTLVRQIEKRLGWTSRNEGGEDDV